MIVGTLVSDRKAYALEQMLERVALLQPQAVIAVLDGPAPYAAEILSRFQADGLEIHVVPADVPLIENDTPWQSRRVGALRECLRLAYLEHVTASARGLLWIDCDVLVPRSAARLTTVPGEWLVSGIVTSRETTYGKTLVVFGRRQWADKYLPVAAFGENERLAATHFACTYTSRDLLESISWQKCSKWDEGEDGYFCRQAGDQGIRPLLMPSVRCFHVDETLFAYGVSDEGQPVCCPPEEFMTGRKQPAAVYAGPLNRATVPGIGTFSIGQAIFADHEAYERAIAHPHFRSEDLGRPLLRAAVPVSHFDEKEGE